jgi:hypothetical protein
MGFEVLALRKRSAVSVLLNILAAVLLSNLVIIFCGVFLYMLFKKQLSAQIQRTPAFNLIRIATMHFSVNSLNPFICILILASGLTACGEDTTATRSVTRETSPNTAVETEQQLLDRARGIHQRVITLDTHADIDTSNFTAENNYTADLDTQVTLPKMH